MDVIEVSYPRELYFPEAELWADPRRPKPCAFISHAHADHFGRHERVICSTATAILLRKRFGLAKRSVDPLEFGETREMGGFRYELFPAGHIIGSAMLLLTRLDDGNKLLYTGDFKVRSGRTAEVPVFPEADTLITETTFGLPRYVFPPLDETEAAICAFAREALDDGEVPVLFGYSLGKAQEIHAILHSAQIPVVLHPTVAKMNRACEEAGMTPLPYQIFDGVVPPNSALICPPNSVRSTALRKLKNKRTAMMSGWAMNPGAQYRYRTDTAFPLSDHADHPGLLWAVEKVKPKRVLTLHGSAREFAAELRDLGYEAWSLFGNDQLEFGLGVGLAEQVELGKARPRSEFADLTDLTDSIRSNAGKLKKVAEIAQYLGGLSGEKLPLAARYLSGRAFGRGERRTAFNLGAAAIRQAICTATSISEGRYREVSAAQADSARTVRLILEGAPNISPEALSLSELEAFLKLLAAARGARNKVQQLADRLVALHPKEGEMLIRLVTGGLRIGLKEGLLEEGIARAFDQSAREVRRAHMLVGDIGELAVLAKDNRLKDATLRPFVPVACMLASPEETAEAILDRMGEGSVWVEDKFDGIRIQVHKQGEEVELYSRDLRNLGSEFAEVIDGLKAVKADFVIDGELIAYAEGRKLNFFDLQKRLGSKALQGDLFLGESVPVKMVAFDILWSNGEPLIDKPLAERRRHLDQVELPPLIDKAEVEQLRSTAELERAFVRAKQAGNEGLIIKDPKSLYAPGRRGKSWLKLKKAMPTLDCVVVKAQQGHGKRAEVLSDYTFAVRDEESGELRIIGKAYSGLTDIEIEELTERFLEISEGKNRRVHTVRPEVVLEIAFDSIRPSKRHNSGLAMRFPRIKAIRRDKTAEDIDTLQYARSLVGEV